MKKIFLMICALMLTACTPTLIVEEEAVIKLFAHNETYGTQFIELWNESYPEHQGIVEVTTEKENADVFIVEDTQIASVIDQCLEFDPNFEIDVNESFNHVISRVKECYYPLFAQGEYYFAVDTTANDPTKFTTFEQMPKNSFYYLENPTFLLSLLSSDTDYFPGNNTQTINFDGKSFKQALADYLTIRKQFKAGEANLFDQWFIKQTHASGFVTEWMQLNENETINQRTYQIQPLPTINGHQLKTTARSFGYVISENTQYPQAAQMVIELMHTQKGMQLLCNDSTNIPLLNQEDIEKFTFDNPHIQEKANALTASMPLNLVALENGKGAIDFLTLESTFKLIDECNADDLSSCIATLDEAYQQWMK